MLDAKENSLVELSTTALKSTAEKVALKETSVPQLGVDDLVSPVKKKQRVSSTPEKDATDEEVKEVAAACRKISLEPDGCEKREVATVENTLAVSDFDSWSDYECEFDDSEVQKMYYEGFCRA